MGGKFNEEDLKSLEEMGFTRSQAEEALSICDGNKEHAATYLMGKTSPKRK